MYAVVAVALGMIVGKATGGRFSNVGRRTFRALPSLVVGVALQIVTEIVHVARSPGALLVLASYAALALFAGANLRLGGMGVVALGLLLNILPIAVNRGMPVRGSAIVEAGIVSHPDRVASLDFGGKRHLESPADRLTFLGDILPDWIFHEVLSFGDLVMSAGIAAVLVNLLRGRRHGSLDEVGQLGAELPGAVTAGTGGLTPATGLPGRRTAARATADGGDRRGTG